MAEREASATGDKDKVRGAILDSATLMGIVPKEKQLGSCCFIILFKEEISSWQYQLGMANL